MERESTGKALFFGVLGLLAGFGGLYLIVLVLSSIFNPGGPGFNVVHFALGTTVALLFLGISGALILATVRRFTEDQEDNIDYA